MSDESNAQVQPEDINGAPGQSEGGGAFEAELAKTRDELLRALAEIDNTRKRAERQASDARAYAIDRFARDLLPVADTLTRALQSVSPEATDEATRNLIAGLELTERAMIDAFSRHGLKRVGAKGEPFNPNIHQAVAQQPSEQPANTVLEVLQPGYVLADRTLRAAMVLVSAGPAAQSAGGAGVDIKV